MFRLADDMSSFYEVEANRQQLLEAADDGGDNSLKEGQVVAARFVTDGKWYRARVVSVLVDDYDPDALTELDIDFLDFGDCERIRQSDACPLLPQFLNLKFQAIECHLANVQPIK